MALPAALKWLVLGTSAWLVWRVPVIVHDFAELHLADSTRVHHASTPDAAQPPMSSGSGKPAPFSPSAVTIRADASAPRRQPPSEPPPRSGFTISLPPPSAAAPARQAEAPQRESPGGALAEQAYQHLRAGNRKQAAMFLARAVAASPGDPRASAWTADRRMLDRRWSGDAYVLVRKGGGSGVLGATPTLGGSQAGARLAYMFNPLSDQRLTLSGRAYQPLGRRSGGSNAAQLAVGLELQPRSDLPVTVALDRYVAAGRHARDAWALRVTGGIDDLPVASGFSLSFYGQGGIIGVRSRDGYADGWARLHRPVAGNERINLKAGAGVWAGAQPGAHRVDIGPTARMSGRMGAARISAAIDYRFRVAGNASPGSGPSITFHAGF